MKNKMIKIFKRFGALTLLLVITLCNIANVPTVKGDAAVYQSLVSKATDPSTVNNWKDLFGDLDTTYAGAIWSDKSVFGSAEDYLSATDESESFALSMKDPDDFLISLSTIASTKTVEGHSTLPTDTVFVLDVSGSMNDNTNRDSKMVESANKAIGDLLALNSYNRVGVVLYSGTNSNAGATATTVLLPLDRYTTTDTTKLNNQTIPLYIYLNSSDYVNISTNVRNSKNSRPTGYRQVTGATYIQKGIYAGMELLTAPDLNTVITDGF